MKRICAIAGLAACVVLTLSAPLAAQEDDGAPRVSATFLGDTGLWFVPTARILEDGKWSVSGHAATFNRPQGFSAINNYAGTFAYGLRDRIEVFGSVRFITRIDRDVRPIFDDDPLSALDARFRGLLNDYPLAASPFSGSQFGEMVLGGKVNLLSDAQMNPVSFAIRGLVKLPTGSEEDGSTSGKADGEFDVIVSKIVGNAEIAGYGGFVVRGDPDNIDLSNSLRWGVGVGAPGIGVVDPGLNQPGVAGNVGGVARRSVR